MWPYDPIIYNYANAYVGLVQTTVLMDDYIW